MAMNARELEIKTPCTVDWTRMTPADGGRFCGDCKKVVRDLSKMTEDEARALVAKERYGELCVRMLVDRDGNVFFGGDKLLSGSLLSRAKRAAVTAAALALPLAANACSAIAEPLGMTSSEQQKAPDNLEPLMGGVALPDNPTAVEPDAGDASADAKGDASDMDASIVDAGRDVELK
jgi:hypothetical protein